MATLTRRSALRDYTKSEVGNRSEGVDYRAQGTVQGEAKTPDELRRTSGVAAA